MRLDCLFTRLFVWTYPPSCRSKNIAKYWCWRPTRKVIDSGINVYSNTVLLSLASILPTVLGNVYCCKRHLKSLRLNSRDIQYLIALIRTRSNEPKSQTPARINEFNAKLFIQPKRDNINIHPPSMPGSSFIFFALTSAHGALHFAPTLWPAETAATLARSGLK